MLNKRDLPTLLGLTWLMVFVTWVTFHSLKMDAPRLDDTLTIVSVAWVGSMTVKKDKAKGDKEDGSGNAVD